MKENRLVTVVCAVITTLVGLGLVFTLMKILNLITWTWVLVTAPFWVPALAIVAAVLIVMTTAGFHDDENEIE